MPNNWMHIGFIQLILPNAKIIDVRRHPLACGFSNFKQLYARGQEFSYDLAHFGRHYADYVRLMAHWDRVSPGRVHRLVHERLVEDPEAEIRRLLDYLGLPFDEACLNFHETKRPVRTVSAEQVRQPIRKDVVESWRAFEAELGQMVRMPWVRHSNTGTMLRASPDQLGRSRICSSISLIVVHAVNDMATRISASISFST